MCGGDHVAISGIGEKDELLASMLKIIKDSSQESLIIISFDFRASKTSFLKTLQYLINRIAGIVYSKLYSNKLEEFKRDMLELRDMKEPSYEPNAPSFASFSLSSDLQLTYKPESLFSVEQTPPPKPSSYEVEDFL